MLSGVLKSGSPAPKPITSTPSARSSRTRAVTASVAEALRALTRRESSTEFLDEVCILPSISRARAVRTRHFPALL